MALSGRLIPGSPGAPDFPVSIYAPVGARIRSGLVYFHGGASVLGELDTFDSTCG